MLGTEVDLDLLMHDPDLAGTGLVVAHHRARVHRLPAVFHGAQDRARCVVSPDPLDQEAPGLAGVTTSFGSRYSLSLDRARGGLCARERIGDEERVWQVLGASRGEGGILGEGVRQALLRDPTYGPALGVARELSP